MITEKNERERKKKEEKKTNQKVPPQNEGVGRRRVRENCCCIFSIRVQGYPDGCVYFLFFHFPGLFHIFPN